jgi:hypothetical protein
MGFTHMQVIFCSNLWRSGIRAGKLRLGVKEAGMGPALVLGLTGLTNWRIQWDIFSSFGHLTEGHVLQSSECENRRSWADFDL